MLQNYLKIALRNLRRHPFYAFVNIFGLALGIACCLLIAFFIRDEWSYDQFHKDADRIYRIALFEHYEDHDYLNVETPFPFGPLFEQNMPEVEAAVRLTGVRDRVQRGDVAQLERIYMADPGFFEMFDFELLQGDPDQVLQAVHSIVLSETAAQKWFGHENPVGQTLSIHITDPSVDYLVTGVVKDTPRNSSIRFDYLMPLDNASDRWGEEERQSFYNVFVETYIRLAPGREIAELEAKVPALVQQVMADDYQEGAYVPRFQALTDIHLDPTYPAGYQPTSDPRYSFILVAIALFVLLIACINFMTLSMSRSADRAREVGVRKTLGALQWQLAGQFWGEAVWLAGLGLLFGLGIAFLALPAFNTLAEKALVFRIDGFLAAMIVGLVLVTGSLAGSYPAFFMSRYRPVEVLKGHIKMGEANTLRKGLSVVQFALAILLIISTLVLSDQLQFLQNKNLGYEREHVVSIPTGLRRPEGMQVMERFRNEVASRPEVAGVTASLFTFGEGWISAGYEGDDGVFRQFRLNMVDYDFLKTMNISVASGRDFSKDIGADRREAVIVNRAFADLHGWEDPVDKQLPGARFPAHRIIGMVEDFNYASLHAAVEPLALVLTPMPVYEGLNDIGYNVAPQPKVLVRLNAGQIEQGMRVIEEAWQAVAPDLLFAYNFVDDAVDQQYRQEQRLGTIVRFATILVVVIACLGLFGLASLVVMRRIKEIGVRKVMGASTGSIVSLLTIDFVKIVVGAFLLATPAAYFLLSRWLETFAFAINLKVTTFLLAGILAVGIAVLTVAYQAIRAALSNPVESLRYE